MLRASSASPTAATDSWRRSADWRRACRPGSLARPQRHGFMAATRAAALAYGAAIRRFTHSLTAGNTCAEKSASVMIRSWALAAMIRPPVFEDGGSFRRNYPAFVATSFLDDALRHR